jgi:hypothetical protein
MRIASLALAAVLAVGVAVADDKKVTLSGDNTTVKFVGAKKNGKIRISATN